MQLRPRPNKSSVDQSQEKMKLKKKLKKFNSKQVIALKSLHDKTVNTLEEINMAGSTTSTPLSEYVTGNFTEHGTFIMKHEELSIPTERDTPYLLHKMVEFTKMNSLNEIASLKANKQRMSLVSAIKKEVEKQEGLLNQQCDLLIEFVGLHNQFFKVPETEVPEDLQDLIEKYFSI